MEAKGNIELIKDSIKKKYDKEIEDINQSAKEETKKLEMEAAKKVNEEVDKIKNSSDTESEKAYSRILNEERLKAKAEFEEEREGFIKKVFSEAMDRARDFARKKEYLEFVKSRAPKESFQVIAGDAFFKEHFDDVEIDENIRGVKFRSKEVLYDLSLDGIMSSKKDILRHEASRILFRR